MELESSSPYPQEPATCPYPEPNPSSPHDPFQLPEDLSPIYVLVSPMASFPQATPPTPCAYLHSPPYATHAFTHKEAHVRAHITLDIKVIHALKATKQ
jgi:hypothetical protein